MSNLVKTILIATQPKQEATKHCGDCENAYLGTQGVFCGVYREDVWNEEIANECQDYEPQPWVKP